MIKSEYAGFKIIVSRHLPEEPKGYKMKRYWWQADESYQRHKEWCMEFFGRETPVYIMQEEGVMVMSPEHAEVLKGES